MSVHHAAPQIQLRRMSQLTEAVDREDDWTGVTDAALRRKRQNRLNVRSYRRRRARELQSRRITASTPLPEPGVPCWFEDQQAVLRLPASSANTLNHTRAPLLPSTTPPTRPHRIILPLSSDHLITLLQFNVLRACLINRQLLSHLQPTNSSCSTPTHHILPTIPPSSLSSLPPFLHPTPLQFTIPHEPWIDIIPDPTLRDNLILAAGTFDEDELWSDTVGGLFEGLPASGIEMRGVVVWSPPWHASGWEVSEGFCRKWGWALKGCEELLQATNRWRRKRGRRELEFVV